MIAALLVVLFVGLALAAAVAVRANPLRKGLHCQVYLDKLRGEGHAAKLVSFNAECATLAAAGFVGVVCHGFVGGFTADSFGDYAAIAQRNGLQCAAAFGLGQSNSHNPVAAGKWMARVALHRLCGALLVDAEGAWEDEASDRPAAAAMGAAFRELAPDVFVVDQPWPVPTLHGSFPDKEFAGWIDASARQYYFNDWKGRDRVKRLSAWFNGAVTTLLRRLGGLARPQLFTIQGYGWADILADCVALLLQHQAEPMFVWSEPLPDAAFLRCTRAVLKLAVLGYTGPGAVLAFQRAHNAGAREVAQRNPALLTEDGRCGPLTLAALEAWPLAVRSAA